MKTARFTVGRFLNCWALTYALKLAQECALGKVIIMSSNPQATPGSDAPLTPNGFRDLATVIDIFRTLGGIVVLEAATKSHTEKIEQLTQWVSAIPHLEKNVAQNTKDLNEVGRRHDNDIKELEKIAHTAKTLGIIALSLISVILTYLYHRFSK